MATKYSGVWATNPGIEDRLKALLAGEMSSREIAAELSREFHTTVTRSSVIARVHRLGLSLPIKYVVFTPEQKAESERRRLARRAQRERERRLGIAAPTPAPRRLPGHWLPAYRPAKPVQEDSEVIPHSQRCRFDQLTSETCRYMIGDPRPPDHFYCGGQVETGHSWCSTHYAIVFQPPEARRRSAVPAQFREAAE